MDKFKTLVNEDMLSLKKLNINVYDSQKDILLVQSVLGHAHEGHGVFRDKSAYPDVVMKDVCKAYGGDEFDKYVRETRQKQIEGLKKTLLDIIRSDKRELTYDDGFPIFGVRFIEDYKIKDVEAFLKGFVLASRMDSLEWRKAVRKEFEKGYDGKDYSIGYGSCYVANMEKLFESRIRVSSLRSEEHDDAFVKEMFEKGVFVEDPKNEDPEVIIPVFLRMKRGKGTSDNLAMLTLGYIYGKDAMMGAFINDAVDTYDKYCLNPVNGGWDEMLGKEVEEEYEKLHGKKLVGEDETLRFIYNILKDNTPKVDMSSSHRRFCQIYEDSGGLTELEVMKAYLEGMDYPNITFGFDGMRASVLFRRFEERMRNFERMFG